MYRLLSILLLAGFLAACQSKEPAQEERVVQEIMPGASVSPSDLVRTPVSASEPQDTVNVARMTFQESTHDFGTVDEGQLVVHSFEFTNDGNVPLLISSARSTCGCTVPEWPKEAIPPGESASIAVRFNTKYRAGRQTKPITIIANTYPSVNQVFLTGDVTPAPSRLQ